MSPLTDSKTRVYVLSGTLTEYRAWRDRAPEEASWMSTWVAAAYQLDGVVEPVNFVFLEGFWKRLDAPDILQKIATLDIDPHTKAGIQHMAESYEARTTQADTL